MAQPILPITIFLLILLTTATAMAQSETLILASADATVREDEPDQAASRQVVKVLSAGLGRGISAGRLISFIRFDLHVLGRTTPFKSMIIKEARLSLMATSFGLASKDRRFLVTVGSCDAIDWSETTITWRNRPCAEK